MYPIHVADPPIQKNRRKADVLLVLILEHFISPSSNGFLQKRFCRYAIITESRKKQNRGAQYSMNFLSKKRKYIIKSKSLEPER